MPQGGDGVTAVLSLYHSWVEKPPGGMRCRWVFGCSGALFSPRPSLTVAGAAEGRQQNHSHTTQTVEASHNTS